MAKAIKTIKAVNAPNFLNVVERLAQRRRIQRQMQLDGHTDFDLSSPIVDPHRKLRRLIQNLGYIADAIEAGEKSNSLDTRTMLWDGVTTLTANGFAWLEQLETPRKEKAP